MLRGPKFINESIHIKNLKIFTRNVDFGIPTLEIFLSKKMFLRTLGVIEYFQNIHFNIRNFAMI